MGRDRCPDRGTFKTSAKTLFIDRYTSLRESLIGLVAQLGVTKVGVEYPVFNDLWSEGMYGLFLYTCEALKSQGMDVVFFSPMQVKAHARVSLQRPAGWVMMKTDMVEAAKADTGGRGRWNHHQADAYWVAYAASRFWRLLDGELEESDLTDPEKSQFTRIHHYKKGAKAGRKVKKGILYREDERFFRWSQQEQTNATQEDD